MNTLKYKLVEFLKQIFLFLLILSSFQIDLLAQFNYSDFSSTAGLKLVKNAAQVNSLLRLTPSLQNQIGAAYYLTKQEIEVGFQTSFQFQITALGGLGPGADGFTFIIQNSSDSALGGLGSSMGYDGIPNSIVVEFDTYGNDPSANSISVHTRGTLPNSWSESYSLGSTSNIPNMSDGLVHTGKIYYSANLLNVYIDDLTNPALQISVDIDSTLSLDNGKAWVGFTSATGNGYENHDILNWFFAPIVIEIIAPNGGENWEVGTVQNLTWTSEGITNVDIYYSTDRGNTFELPIATGIDASLGTYSWTVSNNPSENGKIKIIESGGSVNAISNTFQVYNINTIIITHGATFDGLPPDPVEIGNVKWKDLKWQFSIADAVSLDRQLCFIHKGSVYQTSIDYIALKNIDDEMKIEDVINLHFTNTLILDQTKDVVIVFDWAQESGRDIHGYSEAAGDVLASVLIDLSRNYSWILKRLHFIGHSRGTVVNSEAVERLFFYASNNLLPTGSFLDKEIHMTTLDAHPAGHWSSTWCEYCGGLVNMKDDLVNSQINGQRIGVAGWISGEYSTKYLDNYFQQNLLSGFIGLYNYPGLNFSSLANINLTYFMGNNFNAHNRVHTWYHGTVDPITTYDSFGEGELIDSVWFINRNFEGFYNSENRKGDLSSITSITNELFTVSSDRNLNKFALIFNGNFSKDFDQGSNGSFIPGWNFQGGENFALSVTDLTNKYVQLGDNGSTDLNSINHNYFYIPISYKKLWFKYRIINTDNEDKLLIFIGSKKIGEISLALPVSDWTNISFNIPKTLRGTKQLLKFIVFSSTADVQGLMEIDDVGFFAPRSLINIVLSNNLKIESGIVTESSSNFTNDSNLNPEMNKSDYFEENLSELTPKVKIEIITPNKNSFIQVDDNSEELFIKRYIFKEFDFGTSTKLFLDCIKNVYELSADIQDDGIIDTILNPEINFVLSKLTIKSSPDGVIEFSEISEDSVICQIIPNQGYSIGSILINNQESGVADELILSNLNETKEILITFNKVTDNINKDIPVNFSISQNYPNPFNPSTTISFSIPERSFITLQVYDMLGREVAELVNEEKTDGIYEATFNAEYLSSGVYIYRISAMKDGEILFNESKQMILIK